MKKFYATYNGIGESDIAVFKTEEERNKWVQFEDDLSKSLGATPENATFQRMPLAPESAILRIKKHKNHILHKVDDFNPNQEWFIISI